MKSVKKIIGIVGDFGFSEKNKKIFQDLDILTLQVKNLEDLKKCDGLFFGSSSFFQYKNNFSEEFLEKILQKIENNFPILCFGQSINLFLEKIGNGNFLEKKGKIFYFEGEILFDFLDSKNMEIKVFKNSFFGEKKINIFKKIFFFLKNFFIKKEKKSVFFEKIGKKELGEDVLFFYKKSIFTIFSPEFFNDKRIYEYFVNKNF